MKKHSRIHTHKIGGFNTSAKKISMGKPDAVRHGSSPAHLISTGHYVGKRSGTGAKSIALGHAAGRRRYATGGHAVNTGEERLRKSRERNDILGSPHYAHGGVIHKGMKAVYKALHSYFENEPQMKKLGATKASVYEGEPHRARSSSKKFR